MQELFMKWLHSNNWFYSQLGFTDIGYMFECEDEGMTYHQMTMNVTHYPLNIPFSICLPKECDDISAMDVIGAWFEKN